MNALPVWAQHLLIGLLAAVLAWAGTDLVPVLRGLGGVWAVLAGLVPVIIGVLTPITRQYGVGAPKKVGE